MRHLHLGDNLGMVLAYDRGRAKSVPLLICCRKAAAYSVAGNCFFTHRWIPSEWNAADDPSRQWESSSKEFVSKRKAKEIRQAICYPKGQSQAIKEQTRKFLVRAFSAAQVECASPSNQISPFQEGVEEGHSGEGRDHSCNQAKEPGGSEVNRAQVRRTDDAGGSCGGAKDLRGVQSQAEAIPIVLQCPEVAAAKADRRRPGLDPLSQPVIHRRLVRGRGQQMPCRRHGLETLNFEAPPAKKSEIAARLEKSGPGNHKAADGVAADSSHCVGHGGSGQPDRSIGDPPDVCDLRSPRGSFSLRRKDLVGSSSLGMDWAVNLHSSEELEASKVDATNETILLNNQEVPWLGSALSCLAPTPEAALIPSSYQSVQLAWTTAQHKLRLKDKAVLYQLRHSGASWDRYRNYRDTLEVKLRGRWSSDSSVRRYEQDALVSQQFEQLPDSLKKKALAAPKHLRALVLGQCGLNGTNL